MARKLGRLGMLGGGLIATGPLLVACGGGPSYDDWAATDGAAGRINLDDVQEAFKKADSVTEFERRVNEIYEGDGIIFIRARQDGEGLTLEGWEDLDGNNEVDDAKDDLLFSIIKRSDQNTVQGHNANGYYRSSFGGGDFLFTYLLLSSFSRGPYFYHTPYGRYPGTLRAQRTGYRNSSRYTSQVSKNSSFNKKFAGSRFQQGRNLSSGRRTYQSTQRTTGNFKSSRSIGRSSAGTARGGRGSGGGSRGGSGFRMILKARGGSAP